MIDVDSGLCILQLCVDCQAMGDDINPEDMGETTHWEFLKFLPRDGVLSALEVRSSHCLINGLNAGCDSLFHTFSGWLEDVGINHVVHENVMGGY